MGLHCRSCVHLVRTSGAARRLEWDKLRMQGYRNNQADGANAEIPAPGKRCRSRPFTAGCRAKHLAFWTKADRGVFRGVVLRIHYPKGLAGSIGDANHLRRFSGDGGIGDGHFSASAGSMAASSVASMGLRFLDLHGRCRGVTHISGNGRRFHRGRPDLIGDRADRVDFFFAGARCYRFRFYRVIISKY